MTQNEFRQRFPEFRQVYDYEVTNALAEAARELNDEVWDTQLDDGIGWQAAHKLSIAYHDPQDPNLRNYLKEFTRIQKRVTSGYRVA